MPDFTQDSISNQPIKGNELLSPSSGPQAPLQPVSDNTLPSPDEVKQSRPTPKTDKSTAKENTSPTTAKKPTTEIKQGTILSGMKTAFLAKGPKEQQASYEQASANFEKSLQDLYKAVNAHSNSKMLNSIATKAEQFQSTRLQNPLEPEKASSETLLENTLKLQALTSEVKAVVSAVTSYGKALQKFTLMVPTALFVEDSTKTLAFAQVLSDAKDFMNTNKPANLQTVGRSELHKMTEKLNQLADEVTQVLKNEKAKMPNYDAESGNFDKALQTAYKALNTDPKNNLLQNAIAKAEAHQKMRFENPIDSLKTPKETIKAEIAQLQSLQKTLFDASKKISSKDKQVVKEITPQDFIATLKGAIESSKQYENSPTIRDAIRMAGSLLEAIKKEGKVTPNLVQSMRQVQDELAIATKVASQDALTGAKADIKFEQHLEHKVPELCSLLVDCYSIHNESKEGLQEKLFGIASQIDDFSKRGDFVNDLISLVTLIKNPPSGTKEAKTAEFLRLLENLQLSEELNNSIFIPQNW